MDEQAGVVELSVVINGAAAQALGLQGRQMFERFFLGKNARSSEAVLAGEQLVEFQSQAVERRFPPIVVGHDESEIVDDVRSILQQQAALLERFHDEADIALFQVADAAVGQFGAATGGAFAEVALLEQQHIVAAGSSIDGDAYAGRSSADDDHVPRFGMGFNAAPHFGSIHICIRGSICD